MQKPDVDVMRERLDYYESFMAGRRPEMPPSGSEVMDDYVEDVEALLAYIEELEGCMEDMTTLLVYTQELEVTDAG
jgi:hypothetical protein